MRRWLLVLAFVLLPVVGLSQPAPRIYWDHDGVGVSRFEVVIDKGSAIDVGVPTPVGQTYSAPLPTVARGSHVLIVRACSAENVCASSAPLRFVQS